MVVEQPAQAWLDFLPVPDVVDRLPEQGDDVGEVLVDFLLRVEARGAELIVLLIVVAEIAQVWMLVPPGGERQAVQRPAPEQICGFLGEALSQGEFGISIVFCHEVGSLVMIIRTPR